MGFDERSAVRPVAFVLVCTPLQQLPSKYYRRVELVTINVVISASEVSADANGDAQHPVRSSWMEFKEKHEPSGRCSL